MSTARINERTLRTSSAPPRILLVEDDPGDARLIGAYLAEAADFGPELLRAERLDEAIRRLAAERVDLVLLDLRLPDAEGLEAVVGVHAASPDAAIVVLTGTDDQELAVAAVKAHAQDYLLKNELTPELLVRSVRQAIERQLMRAELAHNFRNVISMTSDGIVVTDERGGIKFANPAAEIMLGRSAEKLRDEQLGFPHAVGRWVELELANGRVAEVHVVRTRWEGRAAYMATMHDITSRKKFEAELEQANARLARLAVLDPLTQLLNRRALEDHLAREMSRKRRLGGHISAVLIDLDDFKAVNDRFGHAAGDVVLREAAERLKAATRPMDHVARVGGDEFIVLLPETRACAAGLFGERIRAAIAGAPVRAGDQALQVTASLGVAELDDEVSSVEEVLGRARLALARSKRSGKNRTSSSGEVPAADTDRLVAALIDEPDQLAVVAQPIVELERDRPVGHELLIRGPSGVFEQPEDLFRVALGSGRLPLLDVQCFKRCVAAAALLGRGGRVHVNLFPTTLLSTSLELLIDLIPEPAAGRHVIEISETMFVGNPSCLQPAVAELRAAGIRIALDHVGFGQSSLESLVLLEPDFAKLDRRCVTGIARDPAKASALRRLRDAVRALGAEIIAEGVEGAADADALRSLEIEQAQGFHLGRPGPVLPTRDPAALSAARREARRG